MERYSQLIHFLQEDLHISAPSINLALRSVEQTQGFLPIVLWQYGFVTLPELDRIFDWLEQKDAS